MTKALLTCGVIGALLFVVTFTIDGATRPGYRWSYHPVSALALGPRGWLQTSNFVITGALMTAAAVGTRSALEVVIGPALLVVYGLSLVASGVFPMDAMRGYPPGTPPSTPADTSRRDKIHNGLGFLVFASLTLAIIAFALGLSDAGWVAYSMAVAGALVVLIVMFGAAWTRDAPRAGLLQRVMIVVGWSWVALFCLALK